MLFECQKLIIVLSGILDVYKRKQSTYIKYGIFFFWNAPHPHGIHL